MVVLLSFFDWYRCGAGKNGLGVDSGVGDIAPRLLEIWLNAHRRQALTLARTFQPQFQYGVTVPQHLDVPPKSLTVNTIVGHCIFS
jgi:hypothetical protein